MQLLLSRTKRNIFHTLWSNFIILLAFWTFPFVVPPVPSPPPKIPMQRENRPTMTSHKLGIFNPLDASDWTVKKKNKFEAKIYYLAWYGPYLQVKLHYFSEKPLQEDNHSINENWFFHLRFIWLELVCAPCHRTFSNDSKKLKATEQKKQDIETKWSRN